MHFNAANRVVGHAAAAARTVLSILEQLKSECFKQVEGAHFGVSTSNALCDSMGIASCKNFMVLGHCVPQAFALCWQAKVDDHGSLLSFRTARLLHVTRDVAAKHVRLALLPYETDVTFVSSLVHVVGSNRSNGSELIADPNPKENSPEWISLHNAAYEAFLAGDDNTAKGLLRRLHPNHDDWLARHLLS
jgi:hypothetical protein